MKILYNTIGFIGLGLAVLGAFLPILPTTPFLLLASACFVRGNPRMHQWMRTNAIFGQYLRDYEENWGIPLRAKIIALLLLWPSIIYSATLVRFIALKILLIVIASGVTIYLLRIKTLLRDDTKQPPID